MHGDPGLLSCGQVATALGAITLLASEGRELRVWVTETRPYLDGARLAAWELTNAGIEHTVLPDTAVAYLLDHEHIDAVLLGAECIAANGDTANVIGSQAVAELACRARADTQRVPVYICAPATCIDTATPDGSAIPVELRPGRDLATYQSGINPTRVNALNPATDVIPARCIEAFVTELGVLHSPTPRELAAAFAERESHRTPIVRNASPADADLDVEGDRDTVGVLRGGPGSSGAAHPELIEDDEDDKEEAS